MRFTRTMQLFAQGLLLCGLIPTLHALDLTTRKGAVLRNVEVTAIDDDAVTIRHADRTERLAFSDLSPESQQKVRDGELKRKSDEIERLKRDLADREAELKRLRKDNEKLRQDQAAPPPAPAPAVAATSPPPPATLAQPSRPLSEVPQIAEGEVLDARDLVLYYKADPAAADQRFKGRTFRVRGTVSRFQTGMFTRSYQVFLESPERSVDLSFPLDFRPEWKAVFTMDRGRELVATFQRGRMTLLKIGQSVLIQAKCKGLDGEVIEFSGSRIMP